MSLGQLQCDYLSVSQEHEPHGAFFEQIVEKLNPETGEVERYLTPRIVAAPCGGVLQIKSTGDRVTVSGNPSHWNRSSSLFGLQTDDAKHVINGVLSELQLPPFSGGQFGAKISRADFCVDLVTGSPNMKRELLLRQQGSEFPRLKKSIIGTTTYFGKGSASRTLRVYDKAQEYAEKITNGDSYQQKLAEWLENQGFVRYEFQLRRYLKTIGLNSWGAISTASVEEQLMDDFDKMLQERKAAHDAALDELSPQTRMWYYAWRAGEDLTKLGHYNTRQKHRNAIKAALGVDIMSVQVHAIPMREKHEIEVSQAEKPSWFEG